MKTAINKAMNKKRIFSLAFALTLVLGLFAWTTLTAHAGSSVAKVGDTEYTSFSDALNAWTDGTTLTLLSNVTTDSTISVTSGTKTLDLNGYGIIYTKTAGSDTRVFDVSGSGVTLTMKDSGSTNTNYVTLTGWRGTAVSETGTESFNTSTGSGVIKVTGGFICELYPRVALKPAN